MKTKRIFGNKISVNEQRCHDNIYRQNDLDLDFEEMVQQMSRQISRKYK